MDPTTSFVLALIAIVVAGASALFAGISVRQTKKYRPKADLAIRWDRKVLWSEMPPPIPYVDVSVVNHGDGPARDVLITLDNATRDSGRPWCEISAIEAGGHAAVQVPIWRNITVTSEDQWKTNEVPTVNAIPTMTVSWRKETGKGRNEISQLLDGRGWKPEF